MKSNAARLPIWIAIAVFAAGSIISAQESKPARSGPAVTQPASKADNRILWTFPTKAPSYGSGAAGDIDGDGKPEVVFGTYFNDEHVYALNGEDGSLLWKFKSEGGPVDTSVLIYDVNGDRKPEIIFGDSAYGTLFCLDGKGEVVWKYKGQSGTDSPAAAADLNGDGTVEVVYGTMKSAADKTGYVNVLEGQTGKLIWAAKVPGHVQCEPGLVDVNGDGTLDVLATNWYGDGRLRALNGKDGSELWQFETGDSVYHGVSFFDFDKDKKPEIVVADRKGTVWMLEGESGKKVWETKLEKEMEGMVFGPTSLVDADRDGTPEIVVCGTCLHLLDAKGKEKWRNEYGYRSIARGVAVADVDGDGVDDLAFGEGTKLRVVRSDTGKEIWSQELRGGKDEFEQIDNAPLLLDLNGDGRLDVFVVGGRGLSGGDAKQADNYGRATALRAGPGKASKGGGWLMFRGGPRHGGMRE
jgi:outer membrane protein assembly factor BamB